MKRIVKKIKQKEKRKMKNIMRKMGTENSCDVISLRSPIPPVPLKRYSKELLKNLSASSEELHLHAPIISGGNQGQSPKQSQPGNKEKLETESSSDVLSLLSPVLPATLKSNSKELSKNFSGSSEKLHLHAPMVGEGKWGHSSNQSHLFLNEHKEVHEEIVKFNGCDENKEIENSPPIFVEVNKSYAPKLASLKISGSCYKNLPSNLSLDSESKSTIPFVVKPHPNKCKYVENIPEVLQSGKFPDEASENNTKIPDRECIGISENTFQHPQELPARENGYENNSSDDTSFQKKKLRTNKDSSVNDSPCSSSYTLEKLSDGKMLLVMAHPQTLFFHGSFTIQMLVGAVEVLGYEIKGTDQRPYDVYSPTGSSLLCLETKCAKKGTLKDDVSHILSELEVPPDFLKRLEMKFASFDTLILLKKITNSLPLFLNKHHSGSLFPSPTTNDMLSLHHPQMCLHCNFLSKAELRNHRCFSHSEDWDEVLDFLFSKCEEECPLRVMLCGGKSLGKSTLLRFLINKFLGKYEQVLCLDFDPGQSEFTVPGCVSAVLVQKPLLGPHYTHLIQPSRSICVGNFNVAQCSYHYLKCCEDIFSYCQSKPEFSNIPWFFNTMGFVRGLGVEMTVSLINTVSPTDVVQIQSVSMKRNYPDLLTRDYVENFQKCLFRRVGNQESSLQYDLHCFNSSAETQGTGGGTNPWGFEAYKLRDLIILAYFSQTVSKPTYSLLEAPPFSISFTGLKLCVSHERIDFKHYLAAMNGNLVALCNAANVRGLKATDPDLPEILENTPLCPCVGFGVVRGIDMTKRLVFIVSPISETERKSVNCLVLGSVRLPPSLHMCTEDAVGHIPYVVTGEQPILGDRPRQTSSLVKKF